MISNAHFWNAGARSYNPICLNPLLVLEKITPLPGSSEHLLEVKNRITFIVLKCKIYKNLPIENFDNFTFL